MITPDDAAALRRFVLGGGRLVAADEQPGAWFGAVVPDPPRWAEDPLGVTHALAPLPETAGVRTLAPGVAGHFSDAGSAAPAVGDATAVLAAVERVGAGRAVLLADAAPLVNSRLAERDDAAFALAVAGPGAAGRLRRERSRLRARERLGRAARPLPRRPRAARAGRRGARARARPPPRARAAAGARTRAGAFRVRRGPGRRAAARRLAERGDRARPGGGAPLAASCLPGGGEAELRAAALRAGLREDEADAIASGASGHSAALAAARGLARINERRGER